MQRPLSHMRCSHCCHSHCLCLYCWHCHWNSLLMFSSKHAHFLLNQSLELAEWSTVNSRGESIGHLSLNLINFRCYRTFYIWHFGMAWAEKPSLITRLKAIIILIMTTLLLVISPLRDYINVPFPCFLNYVCIKTFSWNSIGYATLNLFLFLIHC